MFVSGFTFIRNAQKLDYPVVEAIRSILPLCDEVIVAVGKGEDETRQMVVDIDPKVRVIDTVWDDSLREGGKVLAVETNKAFAHINPKADWCVYVQGDECYHEKDYDRIKTAMSAYANHPAVEGLLFNYHHFYGSYDFIGDSRTWYRKEVRIVKNLDGISSFKDAQGFRINDRKLKVVNIQSDIHHYGWVRHPKYQMAKQVEAHKLWHDDDFIKSRFDVNTDFDYSKIDSLKRFEGSHPQVMKDRIKSINWEFNHDPSKRHFGLKNKWLYWVEKTFNYRIGEYKNYTLVNP